MGLQEGMSRGVTKTDTFHPWSSFKDKKFPKEPFLQGSHSAQLLTDPAEGQADAILFHVCLLGSD